MEDAGIEDRELFVPCVRRCYCGTILSKSNTGDRCRIHQLESRPESLPGIIKSAVKDPAQQTYIAQQIVNAAGKVCGIDPSTIMSRSNQAPIVAARQLAIYIMWKKLGYSHSWLGRFFDHNNATVFHGCKKIDRLRDEAAVREQIEAINDRYPSMPGDNLLPFDKSDTPAYKVIAVVGRLLNISPEMLLEQKGRTHYSKIIVYLLFADTKQTPSYIATFLGTNRKTVAYSIRYIESSLSSNVATQKIVAAARIALRA